MKVTGTQPQGIADLTAQKAKDKGARVDRSGGQQAQETPGVTNRAAQTLNRIKETIRNEPDVRAERVAEVKAKLKNGGLKVDAEKLAEKMLTAALNEDLERP